MTTIDTTPAPTGTKPPTPTERNRPMADDYTPSESTVRHAYVVIENRRDIFTARYEFDRFIAKVKRDAAREALAAAEPRATRAEAHVMGNV